MFAKKQKWPSNNFILAMIILCTLAIILSNYISTKNIALQVRDIMMQYEYQKIGWEENYTIMKELQKREIIEYVEWLKQEKPKFVERLKSRSVWLEKTINGTTKEYISEHDLNTLFTNVSIKWNKDARISIVEFSDFECLHCQLFHNSWILEDISDIYSESVNFVFKTFPFPDNYDAQKYSEIAKCIENKDGTESYFTYIDEVFSWEDIERPCEWYESFSGVVQAEFDQWRFMWIEETPTILVINHDTLEYKMVPWNVPKEEIETVVKAYLD